MLNLVDTSPGAIADYQRLWDLGRKLFGEFDGDPIGHVKGLDMVYIPSGGGNIKPATVGGLAWSFRVAAGEYSVRYGQTWRVYGRGRWQGRRFVLRNIELIDENALTGPSGPAFKVGTVTI